MTNLPEYYAPNVHFNHNNVQYFLVGDSAFGVPYFRSINNGFESGNVLARILGKLTKIDLNFEKVEHPIWNSSTSSGMFSSMSSSSRLEQESPEDYENFVKSLQTREQLIAHLKAFAVDCIKTSVRSSQMVYDMSASSFNSDDSSSSCNIM